jgi:hypothetical protein
LVGVAEAERQLRPVADVSRLQSSRGFLNAATPDHPLGTDADVRPEQPLQRSLAQPEGATPYALGLVERVLLMADVGWLGLAALLVARGENPTSG